MLKEIKKDMFQVSCISWIIKLLPIPINIFMSEVITYICTWAMAGNVTMVVKYSVLLVFIILTTQFILGLGEIIFQKSMSVTVQKVKMKIYNTYMNNDISNLLWASRGNIKERLTDDFNMVISKFTNIYPQYWCAIISGICYFGYFWIQNGVVAISLLLISMIQIIPPVIIKKYLQVNYEENRDIESKITDCVLEGIQGFVIIKMYDLKDWWLKRINELNKVYRKVGNKSIYASELEGAMNGAVRNILKYGAYGLMGFYVLQGFISSDIALKAVALSGSFFSAIEIASSVISRFAIVKSAEKRVEELGSCIKNKDEIVQNEKIVINNLNVFINDDKLFSISDRQIDLDGLIIVKGSNGCGKSTLLKSIIGLHTEWSGQIKIGGASANNLSNKNFPQKICYISQEDLQITLKPIELYNAIVPQYMNKVLKISEEFGLTTEILNERKINELSGGERKKVFLALAFVLDPIILLLDEPTNSLDERGKLVLGKYLKERKSSTIIVTHEEIFDKYECSKLLLSGGVCYEMV